jgi:putative nucleotidyltransferase with HDIG domain
MRYGIQELVDNAGNLACKPQVVSKVENLLLDPMVALNEVARVISKDQVLAARTFKVANSCFFGRMTKAKTLSEAIITIGLKGLYSLVIVHAISQYYKSFGLKERSFWNHAIGVSIAAMTIASEDGECRPEDVMVCGLLHDIGKDLMNSVDPDLYAIVTKKVANDSVPYTTAEQELFGFTHAEVGFLLSQKWNLPADIQTVVLYHHDLKTVGQEAEGLLNLTSIINLADTMCIRLGMSLQAFNGEFSWEKIEAVKILEFPVDQLTALEPVIKTRIEEERIMFD